MDLAVQEEDFGVGPDHMSEVEEDDTDEDTDKRQYGIYQCLPVDDAEPDWGVEEPETVEEYLRRVRFEARQLPSVVTSSIDPRQFDHKRTQGYKEPEGKTALAECPEELKASPAWTKAFLEGFAALRQRLQKEDDVLSGRVEGSLLRIPPTAAAIDLVDCPSALMPELAELRGLEQVVIVGRLHRTVQHVVKGESLTPEGAAQLYALSARIERPLHADSCAEYRALLRRCCEWRASVSGSRDPMLPHLSILIGISGAYFGQDEELAALWQEDEEGG